MSKTIKKAVPRKAVKKSVLVDRKAREIALEYAVRLTGTLPGSMHLIEPILKSARAIEDYLLGAERL